MDERLHSIPRLWRGSGMPAEGYRTLATGFAELDRELPGGGWPMGAVVELLVGTPGIGELRLLLPTVRQLILGDSHVLFIDPPHLLNAVMLHQEGINMERLLLIHAGKKRDALWSAEQALRNPACGAVLLWCAGGRLDDAAVRRLQVAARDGQSILFLYRMTRKEVSRWAVLRLELLPWEEGIRLSVLKAYGTPRRPEACIRL